MIAPAVHHGTRPFRVPISARSASHMRLTGRTTTQVAGNYPTMRKLTRCSAAPESAVAVNCR